MKNNKPSNEFKSTNYDEKSETLNIEFTSGEVHQYKEVPYMVYQGLISSDSKMHYLKSFLSDKYTHCVFKPDQFK